MPAKHSDKMLTWKFPLNRPHVGIPVANGVQGVMVWGVGSRLHLTISRQGFWDRRGGNPFLSKTTFQEVKRLLEAGDEAGLKRVFGRDTYTGATARPHQLGGGRLEIEFAGGWQLDQGELDLTRAQIRVTLRKKTKVSGLRIRLATHDECGWMTLPPGVEIESARLRPSWDWIGEELEKAQCEPPHQWKKEREMGFEQRLPQDEPLAIIVRQNDGVWVWGTSVGPDAEAVARRNASLDTDDLAAKAEAWWSEYWGCVPRISLPDPILQEMVDYGLYMQGCCTPPQGLACTLQGPLMEETRIPPWSNDYHFNINLQMIYTPAMATNRLEHFEPLWRMLRGWMPVLEKSGESFFGEPGALMLPHAVDDRCQVVGAFWTGAIDHACTAWMALLCWDVCRHGGDEALLRELALPLLRGAFAGYWAMAETLPDGSMHLPVSVSPEYKGSRMDAWGRDASFQLAACHAVLRALQQACEWVGEPPDARWERMRTRLPRACTAELPVSAEYPEQRAERIVLWEGRDLDASHRHHSHLAGITPFKTFDPFDEKDRRLLKESVRAWQYRGAGAWSGWCVPWAASIHAHMGEPEAAVFWLHYWKRLFTNEGRGSLHDAAFPGVSNLDGCSAYWGEQYEVMQLDGRFGALTALLDLMVREQDGVIRVVPRLPRDWREVSFEGILAPGGFLIGAQIRDGAGAVSVTSQRGGPLRLEVAGGERVEVATVPGQRLEFAIGPMK